MPAEAVAAATPPLQNVLKRSRAATLRVVRNPGTVTLARDLTSSESREETAD